jgi:hypothetical protein
MLTKTVGCNHRELIVASLVLNQENLTLICAKDHFSLQNISILINLTCLALTFPSIEKHFAGPLIIWWNVDTYIMEEAWLKRAKLGKWRKVVFPF